MQTFRSPSAVLCIVASWLISGCYRDLDLAICRRDPANEVCHAETGADGSSSETDGADTALADSSVDSTMGDVGFDGDAVKGDDGAPDVVAQMDVSSKADGPSDVIALDGDTAAGDAAASDANPCAAVVCNAPPAALCLDGATRRTFAATGSCSGGTCAYAPIDSACPGGEFCSGGVCAAAPSCAGGLTCGADSCCTSLLVPGGTFKRSYDGATFNDPQYTATISDFRLDKYEITVGRFRKFVDAVVGGWKPAAGSGKHTHLNGGGGLNAGTEPGWDVAWNSYLPTSKASWDGAFAAGGGSETWTASSGANESRPMNCANWFQSVAFCIWDGGFLPSDAEWNYAAAGGNEQRKYPWGAMGPQPNATLAVYGCYFGGTGTCTDLTNLPSVGSAPAGNARWGHADLAGSLWEWTLDMRNTPYAVSTCNDCAYLSSDDNQVIRGGAFHNGASLILAAYRSVEAAGAKGGDIGARCARPR